MALNGSIVITTRVDSGQATKDLESLIGRVEALETAQNDAAKAAANQAEQTSKLSSASNAAGIAMGVLGAAMAAAAIGSIKLAADLEQSRVAFTTLLGSGEKAKKFLDELAAFAAASPFEFKDLQDSSRRLLAFGFAAKDIIPIMNSVGSAVAGLGGGKEQIDRVTLALGQMQAKGKVSAEEMNQIAELGIPGWQMIASAIGKSIPEAMKLAEKGAIDSTTAINALVTGMATKFPGMLEKQSQTINGQLSNLRDGVTMTATLIGEKLIRAFHIADAVGAAARAVSGFAQLVKTAGLKEAIDAAFPPGLQMLVAGIATALTATLIPAIGSVAVAFGTATVAAAPFLAAGAAIGAAAYLIVRNWEPISKFFETLFNGIADMATTVRDWIVNAFKAAIGMVREAVQAVMDFFRPMVERLVNALPPALRGQLSGLLAWTKTTVGGVVDNIGSGLSNAAANVGKGVKGMVGGLASGMKTAAGLIVPDLERIMGTVNKAVANTAFTGLSGKAPGKAAEAVAAGRAASGKAKTGAILGPDISGAARRKALEQQEREEIQSAARVAQERERLEREAQQRTATGLREAYGVALKLLEGDFAAVAATMESAIQNALVDAFSKNPAVQSAISSLSDALTGPGGIAAMFGTMIIMHMNTIANQAAKMVDDTRKQIDDTRKAAGLAPIFESVSAVAQRRADLEKRRQDLIEKRAELQRTQVGGPLAAAGAGAVAGATLGSVIPFIGTAIGAVAGTIVGATAGVIAGSNIGKQINEIDTTIAGLDRTLAELPAGVANAVPQTLALPGSQAATRAETKPAAMPGETPDKPIYTQVVNVRDFRDAFPDSAYFRGPSVDTTRSLNANAVAYR